MEDADGIALLLVLMAIAIAWKVIDFWPNRLRPKRAAFIGEYQWPVGLLAKLKQKHPTLTQDDTTLVSRALKQFFKAHLASGRKFVAMPSQIVDELWHEFILYTREYQQFCDQAFGRFMHHTPAAAMSPTTARRIDDGLRRAWWFACKDEGIDPKEATRLPLLFELDGRLQIPNGFRYDLDCSALQDTGVTGIHCAVDLVPRSCGSG